MAGRLSRFFSRRAVLPLCMLLALVLHAGMLSWVQQVQSQWGVARPAPPRIVVDFVREMKLQAPSPLARARRKTPPPSLAQETLAPAGPIASAAEAASGPAQDPAASPPPEPRLEADAAATPASASMSATDAAAAAASAAGPEPAEFVPGPEWPLSTRLRYRLTGQYRGEIHGQAQVEWLREGTHYQMNLDVTVGPSFLPLISRRLSSDGVLTADGISPRRYDEETRVFLSSGRHATLWFSNDQVQWSDGRSEPRPAGLQDAASQFVQLSWLFLTGRETLAPARQLALPLALPRKLYPWRYQVQGQEQLDTPIGSLATWHLVPLIEGGTRDLKAEVWLAPAVQYLPVRMRIKQDDQTYVDLLIESAPMQAAPDVPPP